MKPSADTPLRVLLVPPMYGGSLPIARYCARALKSLGHVVETFEAPDFHPAFTALKGLRVAPDRLAYLENNFLGVVSQAVTAKAESFEPDLVLALAQAPLNAQALKRLRRDGVATAMWFVEDYRLFTYWRAFAPLYDFFAIIQEDPFFAELDAIGQQNALYLPLAADPDFHAPTTPTSVERATFGSDLSFMGAGYANRRAAFRQLVKYDFKIWGTEWAGDPALESLVQREGQRISSEDCVKIFNASTINLNLHSSVKADELVPPGDFVNPRTFELAACGAFQLVDRRALMDDLFYSDELATFSNMEELLEKIDHFLNAPNERQAYIERGRKRVLEEHTYAVRMQTLIDFVASRREGWPAKRGGDAPFFEGYPPELQTKAAELLDRLQLPRDTAFADLVWAIRQQQGVLDEVETAVLFLDEWQKQYGGK